MLTLISLSIVGVVVISGTAWGASRYLSERSKEKQTVAECKLQPNQGMTPIYTITIKDGVMSPNHVKAHLCDHIMVVNEDSQVREIAFGVHDHHQTYDGQGQTSLAKGEMIQFQLNQLGTFKIHDHLHDETAASFTVVK